MLQHQHLDTIAQVAKAVPRSIAEQGQRYFRKELIRRLNLRGWIIRTGTHLWRGSADNMSTARAKMDMLAYPPDSDPSTTPPILIEIERRLISYRTRTKLQHWGKNPHAGRVIIILFKGPPQSIPEADLIVSLEHLRKGPIDEI